MTEIKLTKRYPHSRTEDITDAFMRGYEQGKKDGLKVGKQIVLGAFETYITADRKTEPQYDIDKGTIKCDNCSESGSYKCSKCDGEMYFKRLEIEDEPQTDKEIILDPSFAELSDEQFVEAMKLIEPQTDCSWR